MSTQLITYINFHELFEHIKKQHLNDFPTKEEYIKFLYEIDVENISFVDELYHQLNSININEFDGPDIENSHDDILKNVVDEKTLWVEFSIGGNDANESTNHNDWGYGHQFKIDLDMEIFCDYHFENYS